MRVPYTDPMPDRPKHKRTRVRGPHMAERLRPKPTPKPDNGNGRSRSRRIPQKATPVKPPAQQEPSALPSAPGNGNGNGGNGHSSKTLSTVMQSDLNPDLPTAERIIQEVAKVAFSDIRLIPGCPPDIPDEVAPAISSFTIIKTVHTKKDGSTIEREETKYTLWPKMAATDQLNRHRGNYQADNLQAKPEFNQYNQYNQYNRVDLSGYTEAELLVLLKAGMALRGEAGREYLELPAAGNSDPGRDG